MRDPSADQTGDVNPEAREGKLIATFADLQFWVIVIGQLTRIEQSIRKRSGCSGSINNDLTSTVFIYY